MRTAVYILMYAQGKEHPFSAGSKKSLIRHHERGGLGRVWNDGHGFLQLADWHGDTLVLNRILLSKKEIKEVTQGLDKLGIKFALVSYGYPDYYFKTLTGIYEETINPS